MLLATVDLPLGLLSGLADFTGELVAVGVGFPVVFVQSGWTGAASFVADAGLAGFVVAVAIVLATLYPLSVVVDRVG